MRTILSRRVCAAGSRRGFTLVEVLVSMVLLLILVLAITSMINSTSKTYRRMTGQVSLFQEASLVFDSVTRNVGEATVKTYLDYFPDQAPTGNSTPLPPRAYERRSDLHFRSGPAQTIFKTSSSSLFVARTFPVGFGGTDIGLSHAVFFHAPLDYTKFGPNATPPPKGTPPPDLSNSPGLLTGCGYYISYDTNAHLGVPGLNTDEKKRFRLVRLFEPTESLETYSSTVHGSQWYVDGIAQGNVRAVADNIVALFIEPKLTPADQAALGKELAPDYNYDSRAGLTDDDKLRGPPEVTSQPIQQNQMPPILRVTMVAIDEESGARLALKPDDQVTDALFQNARFDTVDSYDKDMTTLTANLVKQHMNFRIFSADVPIRAAKWSTVK